MLPSLNFDDHSRIEIVVLEPAGALKIASRIAEDARSAAPVVAAIVRVPVYPQRWYIEEFSR